MSNGRTEEFISMKKRRKKQREKKKKKKTNPKGKTTLPLSLPLPSKSPQPKTSKIINSFINQTNVVQGQRQRKKKVVLDL